MMLSVRAFLAADEGALSRSLEHDGPMGPLIEAMGVALSGSARAAVSREVAAAADGLLDLDLESMLLSAWRTHQALVAAGQATVADPRTTEVVELSSHRASSTYKPHVDLYVNDKKIYELQLTLSALFEVQSLAATVRRGRIVNLQCGRCDVTVELAWVGGTLLQRKGQIEAPLVMSVDAGIPLMPVAELPVATHFRGSARVSADSR